MESKLSVRQRGVGGVEFTVFVLVLAVFLECLVHVFWPTVLKVVGNVAFFLSLQPSQEAVEIWLSSFSRLLLLAGL